MIGYFWFMLLLGTNSSVEVSSYYGDGVVVTILFDQVVNFFKATYVGFIRVFFGVGMGEVG